MPQPHEEGASRDGEQGQVDRAGQAAGTPPPDAIREALARILASDAFARSGRARELLAYVVGEDLEGRGARINSKTIAQDVFGRNEAFDASADPLVRVQMGRTRSLLEDYYEEEGRQDPVRLDIPKGTYRPAARRAA